MIIWLASYPRSGNTFFRIVLNKAFDLKTYSIYNDKFDIAADEKTAAIVGHQILPEGFDIEQARKDETLYIIKTHELPDPRFTDRVIYLLRDGRESTLSYLKYLSDFHGASVTLSDVIRGDVFGGSWGAHVHAWSPGTRADTLLVRFEDLVADPRKYLQGIARFISKQPVSLEIPSFLELKSINAKFFRRGRTDSWREDYSELEHNYFWLKNCAEMIEYGYIDHTPPLFRNPEHVPALRELVDFASEHYARQLKDRSGGTQPSSQDTAEPDRAPPSTPAPEKANHSPAYELNQRGERYYLERDVPAARADFEAAIAEDPGMSTAYNNLAVLLWEQGDFDAALEKMADGLEQAPDDRDLVVNGGQMLVAMGFADEARALYVRYLESDPGNLEVRALLANCHFGGPPLRSEELSAREQPPRRTSGDPVDQGPAAKADPDDVPVDVGALVAAGEAEFSAGNIEAALHLFEQARAIKSDDADVLNNLTVAYWHTGEVKPALACLVSALEADPYHRMTVLNGAQILSSLGQVAEAKALCQRYLEAHPKDPEIARVLCGFGVEAPGEPQNIQSGVPTLRLGGGRRSSLPSELALEVVDFADGSHSGATPPKISVIIPSFNQGKFLEQTLQSVFGQKYPNLEVIVMDGGSTDDSVAIIRKYQDRIAYWQSERDAGQYWAVNEGFRRSTGEIMTWINSDDKLHAGSFNIIASALTQLEQVEWITGIPNVMDEEGLLQWICNPPPVFSRLNYLKKRYDYPSFIQQEGTFWRRSLWEKAGASLRVDLEMAGDLELWTRFFRHAPLYTIDTFTGCFRQQSEQKTAKAMDLYRAEADRILEDEVARAKASGEPAIAPVKPIRLTYRQVETTAHGPALAARIRGLIRPDEEPFGTASALHFAVKRQSTHDSMHGIHRAPLVTAVVSTYNSERFIRGCIEDLEAQTLADRLEIIVVDSGSEENEGAIVATLQKRYSNIRYIRTEDRETIYSAWNRAVSVARGTYVTNANTDDRHRPDAFERMVKALAENPNVALVYADVAVTHEENSTFQEAPIQAHFRWPDFDARNLFAVCYVGPQPMWRRELHQRHGYFDPSFKVAGDYEFWLRLAVQEKFLHLPEVLGLYLSSAGSIEHAFAGLGVQESELARQRHWPRAWGQRPATGTGYLAPVATAPAPPAGQSAVPTGVAAREAEERPRVSVVIATKDRRDLLEHALRSLSQQSYRNWEAIVVNDGGVDVSDLISRMPYAAQIRYIPLQSSAGQVKARNHALRDLRGDIVCFLDDDDVYLPNHLETVVGALQSLEKTFVYTDADLVLEVVKDGVRREVDRRVAPYRHGEYSRARLYADNYIPINTWAIRAQCFEEVGYFDETMTCCEDWDLLLRLAQRYNFTHIEKTTAEVRHRANVIDNVTRVRLSETVAAYQRIFALYTELDADPEVRQARERALDGLHDKLLAVYVEQMTQTPPEATAVHSPAASDGEHRHLARENRWFAQRCSGAGYESHQVHVVILAGSQPSSESLSATLHALRQQLYGNWTATVVSLGQSADLQQQPVDRVEYLGATGVGEALRRILNGTGAPWLAILDAGDVPAPTALMRAVDYVNVRPEWRFIYTDERRCEHPHQHPAYKPDFNREYCYALNYVAGLCFVARDTLVGMEPMSASIRGFTYEACLRVLETRGTASIGHVPEVLVTRAAADSSGDADDCGLAEQRRLLEYHLERCGIAAAVTTGVVPGTTRVDYLAQTSPGVTVVIYAGRKTTHLGTTIKALLEKTAYPFYALRVGLYSDKDVADPGHPAVSFDLLGECERREDYFERIARSVATRYALFLDPAAVVLQPSWLECLVRHSQRSGVTAVGARLITQDGRVVHGGVVTGLGSYGVAGIAHEGLALDDAGYMLRAQCPQNVSALSSACLLIDRQSFLDVGGFDRGFSVRLYQDVDLCQRLLANGEEIVWSPYATLLYLGTGLKTHGGEDSRQVVERDAESIASRWLKTVARDPAYNPNFERQDCTFSEEKAIPVAWNADIRDVPRILSFGTGSYGSWQYRVGQPLAALTDAGIAHCAHVPFASRPVGLPSPAAIEAMQPDILLMHNTLHDQHIDALKGYKRHNAVRVMFGQDDLMFALPPSNPYFKTVYKDVKKRLRKCLDLADGVIVTTQPLADVLRGMSHDVRVVPNYLPRSLWGARHPVRRRGGRPRVGWAGAQQHGGDLALIADVVRRTASEIDWVFFGMCPESIRPYVKEFHRGVPFGDYPAKLASLNLDLAVAPLERNRFNEAKSNLRILEYGAMGWPVVASDIHPYQDGPLCRVPNNTAAWIKAIRERIDDLEAAEREGSRLKAWVEAHWMLEDRVAVWLDALQSDDGALLEANGKIAGRMG